MKYNIRKNWIASFEFLVANPMVIMPFFLIAFLETLVLELIYFATRSPISLIANPIIRKFFGETFLHYPGYLIMLPKLFYYAQIVIYIFFGVFLTAISINVFKNSKAGLPVRLNAMAKNALKNYLSFFVYALIVVLLIVLIRRMDMFIFSKVIRLASKYLPHIPAKLYHLTLTLFLFLTNIIMQTFLILTVPLIVIEKRSLLKALGGSIILGIRNFFKLFTLIFLPFLVYLPLTMLKSFSVELTDKTFPEINLYILILGIVIVMFLDYFIIICASQFLLDREKAASA